MFQSAVEKCNLLPPRWKISDSFWRRRPKRTSLYPGGNINISSENDMGVGKMNPWKRTGSQPAGILRSARTLPAAAFLGSVRTFLRHIFNPLVISFDLEENIDCWVLRLQIYTRGELTCWGRGGCLLTGHTVLSADDGHIGDVGWDVGWNMAGAQCTCLSLLYCLSEQISCCHFQPSEGAVHHCWECH